MASKMASSFGLALALLWGVPGLAHADSTIDVRDQDAHHTALFLAEVLRLNVIVVGDAPRVTINATAPSGEWALEELGRQAHWRLVRVGNVYVLGADVVVARVRRMRALGSRGRAVDLRFDRAPVSDVLRLLDEVAGTARARAASGNVTIAVRNARAPGLRNLLERLGRASATNGAPVVYPTLPTPPGATCSGDVATLVFLRCEHVAALRCAGLITGERDPRALVVRADGARAYAVVTANDVVGLENARVTSVGPDDLRLELAAGPPARVTALRCIPAPSTR